MTIFTRLKELLYKDVSAENESKEMAVLLRIICLIDAVSYFVMFFILSSFTDNKMAASAALFCILQIITLLVTYANRTRLSLILYSLIHLVSMLFYCICLGPQIGYHFTLFVIILLIYYKTDESAVFKMSISVICGLLSVVAAYISSSYGAHYLLSNGKDIVLLLINLWNLMIKIIIISHFFYLKFSASEAKIMLYAKKLEHLATIDALTNLQNRRGMMTHLKRLEEGYSVTNSSFSLVISDIDFFKKINDTYGHDAGDNVLSTLAALLEDFMKDKGAVARWGGEEFLFVFEGTNGDYVFEELNKLKYLIEKTVFIHKNNQFHVTMTFGLEEFDSNIGIEKTIEKADAKLYFGKERGRNCVIY